jgi:cytochrome d ubiquinol oxidase subunit I
MGLIGTRSLDTVMPGIDELVKRAEARIREGIKAYDALQKIREAGGTEPRCTQGVRGDFEDNGISMGYALLLKRYVDDPRTGHDEQISQGRMGHRAAGGAAVLAVPRDGRHRHAADRADRHLLRAVGAAQARRHRWLLKVAVFAIPLPWIAIESGWLVAEFGRQPWVIEGVLPTAVAVSNLGVKTLLLTLAGFIAIYTTLLVIEMKLMLKAIRKGPAPSTRPTRATRARTFDRTHALSLRPPPFLPPRSAA